MRFHYYASQLALGFSGSWDSVIYEFVLHPTLSALVLQVAVCPPRLPEVPGAFFFCIATPTIQQTSHEVCLPSVPMSPFQNAQLLIALH